MKTEMKVVKYMFRIAAKNKPGVFFVYLLRFLERAVLTIQNVVLPKFLIDELLAVYNGVDVTVHLRNSIIFTAVVLGCNLVARFISALSFRLRDVNNEWFNEYFEIQLNDRIMGIDFELTENPEALNQINKANEGASWYSGNVCGILDEIFNIVTSAVLLGSLIGVIAVKCPIFLPIEVLYLVFMALFNKKLQKIQIENWQKLSTVNRVFTYLFFELSDFTYGKDIRLYNSEALFTKKSEEHLSKQYELWKNQAKSSRPNEYGMAFIDLAANGFYYLIVGLKAIRSVGKASGFTIGDCSLCISGIQNINGNCSSIVQSYQAIIQKAQYANEYIKFMEYPDAISKGTKDVLPQEDHIIECKNVSFKYPRTEEYVLRNINLTIPSGQHLALVGLNGAGKTTFVKLLCRLYDVTEGEILIDGINIKEYSDDEYRKLFAVVFQDFKLFAFSLRENIVLGEKEFNQEEIDNVLKLVDLYEDVQKLPQKDETPIYKNFDENGVELSGGQKQKVAICRALYKKSPVVILDEPTAALDPIAEAEIYSTFNTLIGGKTALYISHRLSSCKFCDKIAVFNNKTIVEYGTHDELMKNPDGLYYDMFTTQAKQYISN